MLTHVSSGMGNLRAGGGGGKFVLRGKLLHTNYTPPYLCIHKDIEKMHAKVYIKIYDEFTARAGHICACYGVRIRVSLALL